MTSDARVFDGRWPWLTERRLDWAIGLFLMLATTVAVGLTSLELGFTRDEGYYFKAAELYFGWFREIPGLWEKGQLSSLFSQDVIDRHWKYNHEHPVLLKTLFALSWGVLKEGFGLFELNSSAFRFPAWVFAGFSVALVFALARSLLSRRAALLAALMWVSMPRAYWHMHLSCFDIGVCAAHLWLVLAYLRGRKTPTGALVVGIAFGLAAAVKHNVLVTPAFFVLHWLLMEARGFSREKTGLRIPPLPLSFFAMAFIGPIVFVAHWPYLWPDVIQRIGWYLGFHLNHEHYPILWFKELLVRPPFPVSFPFVMSAVTIPFPVLVLLITGAGLGTVVVVHNFYRRLVWGHDPERRTSSITRVPLGDEREEPSASPALLLLLNAAFPFALIALPSSPIFGGTKHWMNALPFLCVLGAWAVEEGFARAKVALDETRPALAPRLVPAFAVLALLVVLPGFLSTARVHPYGLASYNSIVGYARGAANVGFQRTFWGYEPRAALPLINARTERPGRIHFGDTNRDDHKMYVRDKLLRKDIRYSGTVRGANVVSVQPQGEFKEQWMKVLNQWGVGGPDHVVHLEGVPMATVTFQDGR